MMKSRFWLIPAVLMLGVGCNVPPVSQSGEPTTQPTEIDRRLTEFSCIAGTSVQIATIASASRSEKFSASGSYGSDTAIFNYVFLDAATGALTKLLKDNRSVITTMQQFPGTGGDRSACEVASTPTKWLTYTIVAQDSNNDKALTSEDKVTIAQSDIRGQNYTALISNVDEVYTQAYRQSPEQLFIVYRQDGKKMLATIDLTKPQVIDTKPLLDLGDDVQ